MTFFKSFSRVAPIPAISIVMVAIKRRELKRRGRLRL